MNYNDDPIRLTQYSHGAGCGCKIAPRVLDEILAGSLEMPDHQRLLVGNHSKDDAAVYDLGNGKALVATTDFFMPVVDDPFNFGRIAAANAISDVYAMGGSPLLAIAILGWPVNKLSTSVARQVIAGGRAACLEAGIPLAGGHSIDSPEPIFGLAVNGLIDTDSIKQNNTARAGDLLFLTKPLGVGILTTAEKKGLLQEKHSGLAAAQMMRLNKAGMALGKLSGVTAMTDVTGFGLLGHLTEMADGSGLTAVLPNIERVPLICPDLPNYIHQQAVPGGTQRNWESYGSRITILASDTGGQELQKALLADPQTSGGLLLAVRPDAVAAVRAVLRAEHLEAFSEPIGYFKEETGKAVIVGEGSMPGFQE